jgi:hypothetical protein
VRPVEAAVVRAKLDISCGSLGQLARLLQRRFAYHSSHSFVLLAADAWWIRQNDSDEVATQRLPVFQSV